MPLARGIGPLGRGHGGAAATFLPTDLGAALRFWLEADFTLYQDVAGTTPALLDGDPVGRGDERSGNAFHVTQGTASQRLLLKLAQQNGLPGLRSDGVDDGMSTSVNVSSLISASAYTTFAVFKPIAIDTNQSSTWNNDPVFADSNGYFGLHLKSAPTAHAYNYGGGDHNVGVSIVAGQAVIITTRHEGGNLYIRKNGGTDSSVVSGNTDSTAFLLKLLGGTAFATAKANVDLFALAICNSALTSDQITSMITYLNSKWAVF